MKHLSLFTGIGGIDLAGEWAGFETVGQCEWADFPTKVLEAHWPNTPRWRDIRTLTKESFYEKTGLTTVDLISGGFPCQPFSVAGKRKGNDDDRFLWPEMLRVIRELQPTWVLGENVAGIVSMALEQVCLDLEAEGYAVQAFLVPAAGVEALHRRERCFIVAYSGRFGWRGGCHENGRCSALQTTRPRPSDEFGILANTNSLGTVRDQQEYRQGGWPQQDGLNVADAQCEGLQGHNEQPAQYAGTPDRQGPDVSNTDQQGMERRSDSGGLGESRQERNEYLVGQHSADSGRPTESGLGWMADGLSVWMVEPDIPRVATGIKDRVNKLKGFGNAVVPQQVYPFLKAMIEVSNCPLN